MNQMIGAPSFPGLGGRCRAVIAIPACDEAERIGDCLASLAVQRDREGTPLPNGLFAVLVVANNCRDDTAAAIESLRSGLPYTLLMVERDFPPAQSNAGWARKSAMDMAADLLGDRADGIILTTDADSTVCATWVSNTLAAIDRGADAVAGYIEAQPRELLRLGPAFLRRGHGEDTYLALVAKVYGLCDPLLHDPWPNHRVASGASLAVTVAAYKAIGGLPPKPVGEDAALRETLLDAGFNVRHALDVSVVTSCRLDGRARGGAADTMRARHADPEAPCDAEMEPAHLVTRRALWKGRLRRAYLRQSPGLDDAVERRLALPPAALGDLASRHRSFEPFWRAVEAMSPRLQRAAPLRPAELPAQTDRLRSVVGRLTGTRSRSANNVPSLAAMSLHPPLVAPIVASLGAMALPEPRPGTEPLAGLARAHQPR